MCMYVFQLTLNQLTSHITTDSSLVTAQITGLIYQVIYQL